MSILARFTCVRSTDVFLLTVTHLYFQVKYNVPQCFYLVNFNFNLINCMIFLYDLKVMSQFIKYFHF